MFFWIWKKQQPNNPLKLIQVLNIIKQLQHFILCNIIHLLHAGEENMKIYSPTSIIFPSGHMKIYSPKSIIFPEGNVWVNKFSYFLYLHAINVLLYRMKPRKHI